MLLEMEKHVDVCIYKWTNEAQQFLSDHEQCSSYKEKKEQDAEQALYFLISLYGKLLPLPVFIKNVTLSLKDFYQRPKLRPMQLKFDFVLKSLCPFIDCM